MPTVVTREQILARIRVDPDDEDACWEWIGCLTEDGYGRMGDETAQTGRAHRLSYEVFVGLIPEGLHLDHRCHSFDDLTCPGGPSCLHRRCVRPDHLEPVTPQENSRRAYVRRILQRHRVAAA